MQTEQGLRADELFDEDKGLEGPRFVRKGQEQGDKTRQPSPAVREVGDRAVELAVSLSRPRVMVDAHGIVMTRSEVEAVQSRNSPDARK